jgi:hypothetical protein
MFFLLYNKHILIIFEIHINIFTPKPIKLYEYLQVKLDFSSQQVRLCDGQVMLPINFDFILPFKVREDWLTTPESKLKCMRIIPSRNKFKMFIL